MRQNKKGEHYDVRELFNNKHNRTEEKRFF